MAPEHRVKIYSTKYWTSRGNTYLWYTLCAACQWEPSTLIYNEKLGSSRFGAPSQDVALARGVAHLKEMHDAHLAQSADR